MTRNELVQLLSNSQGIRAEPFQVLKELCDFRNGEVDQNAVQELILRALEHREDFGRAASILDGLVRDVGLFPYLDPQDLGLRDALAFEAHRPAGLERIVFHHPQARVFYTLLSGKSVVLSAPTSFGKSLIVDAIVATQKYSNIVIVVPTLALIDETRRRLSQQFRESYTIITQISQRTGEKNIFVMTQERLLDSTQIEEVDFFVIDEFYKLNPANEHDDRSALLNQVFYLLSKKCKHFYLLGPGIRDLSHEFTHAVGCEFIHEPYHTVVSELHRVKPGKKPLETLSSLATSFGDPTLVFCSSPERTKTIADALPDSDGASEIDSDAIKWISTHYHPEWHFVKSLQRGIGIHHGRVPRALAQYVVRRFNSEGLRFLVCTSTLIEGVNTKAKNIVVYDHKINRQAIDLFTFNNIRGRSGRMFEHFVGHVYVFHDPPQQDLPFVDVPAFTQGTGATDGLLVQLDEEDLTDESESRIQKYKQNASLSFQTIRANVGVDPEAQLGLADELMSDLTGYSRKLCWSGTPSWNDLLPVCELIWDFFDGSKLGAGSAKSAKQLTMMLFKLTGRPSIRELVQEQMQFSNNDPDQAVRSVLDFQRLWATFHFPRLLRALDRIQSEIMSANNLPTGDYSQYATLVEHLFLNPVLIALEEYGIPLPLARKLEPYLDGMDIDGALERIRALALDQREFSPFERSLIEDARAFM